MAFVGISDLFPFTPMIPQNLPQKDTNLFKAKENLNYVHSASQITGESKQKICSRNMNTVLSQRHFKA